MGGGEALDVAGYNRKGKSGKAKGLEDDAGSDICCEIQQTALSSPPPYPSPVKGEGIMA